MSEDISFKTFLKTIYRSIITLKWKEISPLHKGFTVYFVLNFSAVFIILSFDLPRIYIVGTMIITSIYLVFKGWQDIKMEFP